jgi:biotin operon repressor
MSLEDNKDILIHYGIKRRSGRYPYGSGKNPFQHGADFLARVDELKKQGMSETEIAKALDMSTTALRAQKTIAKNEKRSLERETAMSMREHGYSLQQIADKLGYKNDSSVRALLDDEVDRRKRVAQATADILKDRLKETGGFLDVGAGVEREMGCSREKLNEALEMLKMEGYVVWGGGIPQATNQGGGRQTNVKVLCPPGTEHKDIYQFDQIHAAKMDYTSDDGGDTYRPTFRYPASLDSKRMQIVYAEDGGTKKDGVIELRPGVEDISLGNSHYAQVRILVDGTHYLKGMAVYNDDLPNGVDVRFNTNKHKGTPALGEDKNNTVLKKIKDDPDNPFGSYIKEGGQRYFDDPNGEYEIGGVKKSLSPINKKSDEGDWHTWSNNLPSQFLSKQSKQLIDKQLNLAKAEKKSELDEILSLENPTIKRQLLNEFANDCDSAAVHLKAAAMPRQRYQVILPITSLKDTEVYAPNFNQGEQVALIRYPHGGTFEIPVLRVNNSNEEGKKILGPNPMDAIGINSNVAERLSGADFDGDTVMVIPFKGKTITSTPQLEGLVGFDPKMEYGGKPEGTYKRMTKKNTQNEMGKISNLITDMTLKGANPDELSRAVRHSMVVIDAEKHGLDYKASERDNGIAALKQRYQGHIDSEGNYKEGAGTIISRAKSETSVLKRRGQPWVNKETGALEWERINPKTGEFESKVVDETYVNKKGKTVQRTQKSTKMAETNDAYTLVSDPTNVKEVAYADYANYMKGLANQARKEAISTPRLKYDPLAKKEYATEVKSLNEKLDTALRNAPRERQAQAMANSVVNALRKEHPELEKEDFKKKGQMELEKARIKVGAKRRPIEITDREWEAIQKGAITDNKLAQILTHTDADKLKERATPRQKTTLSEAKVGKLKAMKNSGYTNEQIAKSLGVSTSTVVKHLKEAT